jgi:hypothetical protein
MKKIIFMGLIVLAFSACQDTYTTEEYNVNTDSKTYSVHWELNNEYVWEDNGSDATGLYYFCEIPEPKLTNEIFQHGQLNAYLYYVPEGTNLEVLSPLPFSDFITKDEYGRPIKREDQVTVEFTPGLITFILKKDNHENGKPFYETYDFVVKFMW